MPRFRRDCLNLLREMSVRDMRRKVETIEDTFVSDFGILYDDIIESTLLNKHKYSDIVIKLKIYDPNVCDIMWNVPVNEVIYLLKNIYISRNIYVDQMKIETIEKKEKIVRWLREDTPSKIFKIKIRMFDVNKYYF